jgi:hypothetical protein
MEPVYFNTRFIYRFGNDGIIDFGGEEDNIIDTCTITWKHKDISLANHSLQQMSIEYNIPLIDISSYDKNKTGTEKLLAELVVRGGIPNEYLMGCIICHQLQYKVPLEATFLSGQPNSEYNSDCDSCIDEIPYFEAESNTNYDSE